MMKFYTETDLKRIKLLHGTESTNETGRVAIKIKDNCMRRIIEINADGHCSLFSG